MDRVKINPARPDRKVIDQAVKVLKDGGIVAYPTDTVYGLAALATDAGARCLREAKDRPASKSFLVALLDVPTEGRWVAPLTTRLRHAVAVLWPQKVSLLLPAGEDVPDLLRSNANKVGLRRAADPVTRAIAAGIGGEVISTSANVSGEIPGRDPDVIARDLEGRVDLLLDGGALEQLAQPSTLVDPVTRPVRVLREGAVTSEKIFDLMGEAG